MKILVGILFCDEPQFNDCIESVKNQEDVDVDYFVIKNMPKNLAHDKLYKTFMESRGYDLFVKLDADMVIQKKDFFGYIVELFENNQLVDWLHIWIYDYFLDDYISGLNIYRKGVEWNINKDNYFTDRTLNLHSVRKQSVLKEPEIRWVIHCPNPSYEQAFNFGLHRSIKAFQFGSSNRLRNNKHGVIIKKLFKKYLADFDKKKLIAIYSFLLVIKNKLNDSSANKTDLVRVRLENKIYSLSKSDLIYKILSQRDFWIIFLLDKYGYYLLFHYYSKKK